MKQPPLTNSYRVIADQLLAGEYPGDRGEYPGDPDDRYAREKPGVLDQAIGSGKPVHVQPWGACVKSKLRESPETREQRDHTKSWRA